MGLSIIARGLYSWLCEKGTDYAINIRRMAAEEDLGIGRTLIANGLRELREAGLVTMQRTRTNGQWSTYQTVVIMGAARAPEAQSPEARNLACLTRYPATDSSTNSHPATSQVVNSEIINHSGNYVPGAPRRPEGAEVIDLFTRQTLEVSVGYEMFDDEPVETPKAQRKIDDDDEGAAVGRIAEARKRPAQRVSRAEKPTDQWNARDLAAEFGLECRAKYPMLPYQSNQSRLAPAMAKLMKDYDITAPVILEMMRAFFEDDRHFSRRDGDYRARLWRIFLDEVPHLLMAAQRAQERRTAPQNDARARDINRRALERLSRRQGREEAS